jgi:hypothetical protein
MPATYNRPRNPKPGPAPHSHCTRGALIRIVLVDERLSLIGSLRRAAPSAITRANSREAGRRRRSRLGISAQAGACLPALAEILDTQPCRSASMHRSPRTRWICISRREPQ